MVQTLTIQGVEKLIRSEKAKGRKALKIKTSQWEFLNGRPRMYLQTKGLEEVEKHLTAIGCKVEYERNEKQVSVGYNMTGAIKKCSVRNLHTSSLIVKW